MLATAEEETREEERQTPCRGAGGHQRRLMWCPGRKQAFKGTGSHPCPQAPGGQVSAAELIEKTSTSEGPFRDRREAREDGGRGATGNMLLHLGSANPSMSFVTVKPRYSHSPKLYSQK